MTNEPTRHLQQIIDSQLDAVPWLVDQRTDKACVFVAAEQYERIKAILEQDDNLSDTYPAQIEAAMRAGWGDPAMDDYDCYHEDRN